MRYIVIDLEATCWQGEHDKNRMEIIELGAVCLESAQGPAGGEFGEFIRPADEPVLSDFCTQLTTIRQDQVDKAEDFPDVLAKFVAWIGDEPFMLCSWGVYDLNQLRLDCRRHNVEMPASFERHINLKKEFARIYNVRPCGMKGALMVASLPLEGTHHRGIDDAKNIARLALLILPEIERAMQVEPPSTP